MQITSEQVPTRKEKNSASAELKNSESEAIGADTFRLGSPGLISVSKTVDAIIGNQAFQNGRNHSCFSLGLGKVETGFNLLIE